ncbi:MAG: histidine phosphatase family protein [Pseudomonadota bacterium]
MTPSPYPQERTFFFVRHGQTEWNAAQRMQGRSNSPLTDLGLKQADLSGALLAQFPIEKIYSSPLGRVQQTVASVQNYVPLTAVIDDRLKEWHCGEWSGHLYKDLRSRWPVEWSEWQADRYHVRPPGGENYPDMAKRARSFLDDVLTTQYKVICIISHGMIGRIMVSELMGLDEKKTIALRQANDVVIRVILSNKSAVGDHFVKGNGPRPGLPISGPERAA